MLNTKMMAKLFTLVLFIVTTVKTANTSAETEAKEATTKNCRRIKDGKMVCVKKGKTMPMNKNMTMKTKKKSMPIVYKCPIHSEFISNKPGICPKCKTDLVAKKSHLLRNKTNQRSVCFIRQTSIFLKPDSTDNTHTYQREKAAS